MKKLLLIAGSLIISALLSMNVYAANITFSTDIFLSGWETYSPADTLVWQNVDGMDLTSLPQFDPSLGTLNTVTFSVSGFLIHGANLFALEVIDSEEENSMSAEGFVGITITIPVGGSPDSLLWDTFINSADCNGSGDIPCNKLDEPDTFDDVNIFDGYTGSDPEMATFIGNGDLGDITLELFFALNSFNHENLVGPEADLIADLGSIVTVEYDFTPVPVPGAFFLLGSGLISLIGLQRRRRK